MIKIEITEQLENEMYEKELTELNSNNYWYTRQELRFPEKYKIVKKMETEITKEQFEAIRKEILKNF